VSTVTTSTGRWSTIAQTAAHFGVHPWTVRQWISKGLIHAERIGPRLIRVDIESMQTRTLNGNVR